MVGLRPNWKHAATTCPTTCGRRGCCSTRRTRSSLLTRAFFQAGAAIATTASYQASFDGFAASGIERDDAERLMRRSVELARGGARRGRRRRPLGGGVGRAVRRGAGQRRGVRRPVRAFRRGVERLASAAAGNSGRRGSRRVGDRDRARYRRGRGVGGPGAAARRARVVELHDRWSAHPRGAAAGGGVRRCRGRAGDRRGGRELLRARRCVARDSDRARGDRQARHRLPQQRRGVGRRTPHVDRHGAVVVGPAAAVGSRGRTHRRRLLPGDARRHRGTAATLTSP